VVVDDDMVGKEPDVKVKLDLNFATDFEVSDYMKEGDKGFKLKKRRPKKSSRRRDDEDEDAGAMDVDPNPMFTKRIVGDDPDNLIDDDDLQAALARSRRQAVRTKKPKIKAEDLAYQLSQQRAEEAAAAKDEPAGDDDNRITFDDTSEFVRNVTAESRAAPVKRERTRSHSPALPPPLDAGSAALAEPSMRVVKIERASAEVEADVDAAMESGSDSEDEDDELAELAAREGLSLTEYRQRIDAQMSEMAELKTEADAEAAAEASANTGGMGMAGMLSMLRNQGTVTKAEDAAAEADRKQKQHDLWLADHRRRAAQRELERIAARGGNKDQAQREYENRMREQQEARDAVEAFKSYKPDVNIVYHDEFGRKMTPKEAWKSLSHKFQ
jgi:U4/U6.U5 tri-snRNP-associated protein 1